MAKFCTVCGTELVNGICPSCQPVAEAPKAKLKKEEKAGNFEGQQNFGGQQIFDNGQQNFGGQQGFDNGQQNFRGQQGFDNGQQNFGGQQGFDNGQQNFGGQQGFDNGQQNYGGQQGFGNGQQIFGGQQGYGNGQQNFGGQQGFGNGQQNFGGQQGFGNGQQGSGFQPYTAPSFREMWIDMKNRMGIGEPESNNDGVYERGMQIVPENLQINEGEIPIRQYDAAVLRSRLQFMRAEGRLQVTNKRLLFRATGRSIRGKTTLQHEFAIDEIAGFDIRKDFHFSFLDLILSGMLTIFSASILMLIVMWLTNEVPFLGILLGMALGLAGMASFFLLHKHFLTKMVATGSAFGILFSLWGTVKFMAEWKDSFMLGFLAGILLILFIAAIILFIFATYLFCYKPNLIFEIKTKGGQAPIQIRKDTFRLFGGISGDYSGYREVLPAADTEKCLRELGALINDIQKLGDFAAEKWAQK